MWRSLQASPQTSASGSATTCCGPQANCDRLLKSRRMRSSTGHGLGSLTASCFLRRRRASACKSSADLKMSTCTNLLTNFDQYAMRRCLKRGIASDRKGGLYETPSCGGGLRCDASPSFDPIVITPRPCSVQVGSDNSAIARATCFFSPVRVPFEALTRTLFLFTALASPLPNLFLLQQPLHFVYRCLHVFSE